MSLLDVLDKLEKFKVIESSEEWMLFRKLRNTLTNEYPGNEQEIVMGIKEAPVAFQRTEDIVGQIKSAR